jgi:alpha-L-fucosidase
LHHSLLDIGPTAEGEIIEAMMEGLLDTGAWLDYSGSCIYDTVRSPSVSTP